MPKTTSRPKAKGRTAQGKGRGAGAGKRGKGPAKATASVLPSVTNHPRGGAQVKRAKGWGGLAGFALAALLSWRANVPVPDTLLRALAGGIVAYLVVWACAVAIWRHVVLTELRLVREQRAEQAKATAAATKRGEAS